MSVPATRADYIYMSVPATQLHGNYICETIHVFWGSYIEEFWNDAYLDPDDPVCQICIVDYRTNEAFTLIHHAVQVVLNINPFFILEDDPTPTRRNQVCVSSCV